MTLVRVRELLSACAWTELHALLQTIEHGLALHPLCAEEARRAWAQLKHSSGGRAWMRHVPQTEGR